MTDHSYLLRDDSLCAYCGAPATTTRERTTTSGGTIIEFLCANEENGMKYGWCRSCGSPRERRSGYDNDGTPWVALVCPRGCAQ